MEVGDMKEEEGFIWWRLKRWLVCTEKKKNFQRFQAFSYYDNAVIFAELIKQRKVRD